MRSQDTGVKSYVAVTPKLPQLIAVGVYGKVCEQLEEQRHGRSAVAEHGPLKLEAERMRVTWNNVEVPLTVTEFWMVHTLVRFPGHVKNRDQLMREAQVVVDDATITSHVKRIRRKFQAVDPAFDCIDTVYGIGYRWN